jgi:hypothetical protein
MAGTAPRLPELFRTAPEHPDFQVSELVSEAAGAHSPFGDVEFPLPIDKLLYKHPSATERPALAEGR